MARRYFSRRVFAARLAASSARATASASSFSAAAAARTSRVSSRAAAASAAARLARSASAPRSAASATAAARSRRLSRAPGSSRTYAGGAASVVPDAPPHTKTTPDTCGNIAWPKHRFAGGRGCAPRVFPASSSPATRSARHDIVSRSSARGASSAPKASPPCTKSVEPTTVAAWCDLGDGCARRGNARGEETSRPSAAISAATPYFPARKSPSPGRPPTTSASAYASGGSRVHVISAMSRTWQSARASPSAARPPCTKTRPAPDADAHVVAIAASRLGAGTSPNVSGELHVSVAASRRQRSFRTPPASAPDRYPPKTYTSTRVSDEDAAGDPARGVGAANAVACDRRGGAGEKGAFGRRTHSHSGAGRGVLPRGEPDEPDEPSDEPSSEPSSRVRRIKTCASLVSSSPSCPPKTKTPPTTPPGSAPPAAAAVAAVAAGSAHVAGFCRGAGALPATSPGPSGVHRAVGSSVHADSFEGSSAPRVSRRSVAATIDSDAPA